MARSSFATTDLHSIFARLTPGSRGVVHPVTLTEMSTSNGWEVWWRGPHRLVSRTRRETGRRDAAAFVEMGMSSAGPRSL